MTKIVLELLLLIYSSESGLAMLCYVGKRNYFLPGLLWLYLLGFGLMALSLEPGFLDFDNLPDTNFSCVGKVIGGYYADLETNCQMFHVCTIGQLDEPMDIRFLCLNGTVFDQETRVCERIDEVDCSKSEQFYSLNLELYGNSQHATLEDNSETEQPLIIKSTSTSTTTPSPTKKSTRTPYFTTLSPRKSTTTQPVSHHFPVINPSSSDIRYNPEEINISLHPGAPPDIRTKHEFQGYGDSKVNTNSDNKVAVTTNRVVINNSPQTSKTVYNRPTPSDINYEFTYRQSDDGSYRTELPSQEYHYRKPFRPSQEYTAPFNNNNQFKPTTFHTEYHPTTQKINNNYQQKSSTTARTYYIQSLKPPNLNQRNQFIQHRTEKPPQRLQLPLPLLPSISPITFSSPAPFTLQHHIDTKRYTKDHAPPPRIIISASASVSDASGRRLNYSLGTIGAAEILEEPPSSYDDYKEVIGLEHFYHDVPKLKHSRRKRGTETQLRPSDIIKSDEDAVRILKFLFDWYKSEKTNPARLATTPLNTPLPSEEISQINEELSPQQLDTLSKDDKEIDFDFKTSDLFNKLSKYSIVGADEKSKDASDETTLASMENKTLNGPQDYVDDNYEPETYKQDSEHFNKHRFDKIKENHDEIAKNRSYAFDYVDDNIEPLYYREKDTRKNKILGQRSSAEHFHYNLEKPEHVVKSNAKEIEVKYEEIVPERYKNSVNVVNQTEVNTESVYPKQTSEQTLTSSNNNSKNLEQANQYGKKLNKKSFESNENTEISFVTEINEIDNINNTQQLFSKSVHSITESNNISQTNVEPHDIPYFTTSPTFITKETPKPTRPSNRSNANRGRRKFNTKVDPSEQDFSFKTILTEKFIEKTYRAKDDYDFLRTVSRVPSSTVTSQTVDLVPNFTEEVFLTETTNATVATSTEVRSSISDEILLTTTSTTERTNRINRRRGRNKHNQEKAKNKRRKSPKINPESEGIQEQHQNSFKNEIKSLPSLKSIIEQNNENNVSHSEPIPENNETKSILDQKLNDEISKSFTNESTHVNLLLGSEVLGTVEYSTIESVTKYTTAEYENIISTTSPTVTQIDNIEEIYATSFVPTEKVHITKKKQLKNNFFPVIDTFSEIETTKYYEDTTVEPNENNKETDLATETTLQEHFSTLPSFENNIDTVAENYKSEEISTENPIWSTESLEQFIKEVETTTKSIVASAEKIVPVPNIKFESKLKENAEDLLIPLEKSASNETTESEYNLSSYENMEGNDTINEETSSSISVETSTITPEITLPTESTIDKTSQIPTTLFEQSTFPTTYTSTNSPEETTVFESTSNENNHYLENITTDMIGSTQTDPNINEIISEIPTTILDQTTLPTTTDVTTNRPETSSIVDISVAHYRGNRRRNGRKRPSNHQRSSGYRHRFNTESFTRKPENRRTSIEDEIIEILTTKVKRPGTTPISYSSTTIETPTNAPLWRSASPTQAEKASDSLPTTPLSRKTTVRKQFFFNCFNKKIDRFYPDPRDCRLFHYCTQGYNKNQLLDMKFVCDFNTYFDDENLVCTKQKPKRCL